MTTVTDTTALQQQGINTIRGLAMDAPLAASSGHQGTAMALAPLAHVLYTQIMKYDASDPLWADRDRFVLSPGHASILQYSLLYLTGQGLELDDIKQFRQLGSLTPGHPEAGHTPGVEVTTGPLGQGFANAVGLAIAERHLQASFGEELVDHFTYVIVSDGDLSEGISHEAASFAGHQKLGKLIAIYDDNHISIDGRTDLTLSDDAAKRFESYGWDVQNLGAEANNIPLLADALRKAKETDKPTLLIMQSQVGYPSPDLTDNHKAHGNPFGAAETAATKKVMGMPEDKSFYIPEDVLSFYREAGARGSDAHKQWKERLAQSPKAEAWKATHNPTFKNWAETLSFSPGDSLATRKASQQCITALAKTTSCLIGGSADLTGNTGLAIDDTPHSFATPEGKQLYFGIREHAMGAALVGAAKHGGVLPLSGTFLVFSDYMRPSIRLAAMTESKCIFIFTHDSVGVGEDGPTHQPVEHVMALRSIPGLQVIRPADAKETIGAWQAALDYQGPTALILSRQDLPISQTTSPEHVAQGGYALTNVENPDVILLATGSELSLCEEAAAALKKEDILARVVSIPCWKLFEKQGKAYRTSLLPKNVPTISVEAGVTLGWERYASITIGVDRFGISAPGKTVFSELGITVENIVTKAKEAQA